MLLICLQSLECEMETRGPMLTHPQSQVSCHCLSYLVPRESKLSTMGRALVLPVWLEKRLGSKRLNNHESSQDLSPVLGSPSPSLATQHLPYVFKCYNSISHRLRIVCNREKLYGCAPTPAISSTFASVMSELVWIAVPTVP